MSMKYAVHMRINHISSVMYDEQGTGIFIAVYHIMDGYLLCPICDYINNTNRYVAINHVY